MLTLVQIRNAFVLFVVNHLVLMFMFDNRGSIQLRWWWRLYNVKFYFDLFFWLMFRCCYMLHSHLIIYKLRLTTHKQTNKKWWNTWHFNGKRATEITEWQIKIKYEDIWNTKQYRYLLCMNIFNPFFSLSLCSCMYRSDMIQLNKYTNVNIRLLICSFLFVQSGAWIRNGTSPHSHYALCMRICMCGCVIESWTSHGDHIPE